MESNADCPAAASSPDWATIGEEILCPLCEYDLRMLTAPRCPECGYRFDWPDALDPTRRLHRYIFEHHPERNWWSFWKTAIGGLRPRRFWTSLQPVQPSNRKRLVLYWGLIIGLVLACFAVQYVRSVISMNQSMPAMRAMLSTTPPPRGWELYVANLVEAHGTLEAALDAAYPVAPSLGFFLAAYRGDVFCIVFGRLLLYFVLWPWLTILALLVFQESMSRARIRNVHVLRCVLYSFDAGLWAGPALLATTAATFVVAKSATLNGPTINILVMFCLLLAGSGVYRLWIAYRKYLQFNHALLTVLSSQFIVFLCLLFISLQLST